jgi:hypothetical protein
MICSESPILSGSNVSRVQFSWILGRFKNMSLLGSWASWSTWDIASLRTSTPGYIAERACREKSCWTSLAWWRRIHNSVDLWQCVIFRTDVGSHQRARWQRQVIAVLPGCPPLSSLNVRVDSDSDLLPARETALIDLGRCLRRCSRKNLAADRNRVFSMAPGEQVYWCNFLLRTWSQEPFISSFRLYLNTSILKFSSLIQSIILFGIWCALKS